MSNIISFDVYDEDSSRIRKLFDDDCKLMMLDLSMHECVIKFRFIDSPLREKLFIRVNMLPEHFQRFLKLFHFRSFSMDSESFVVIDDDDKIHAFPFVFVKTIDMVDDVINGFNKIKISRSRRSYRSRSRSPISTKLDF
jgi:hypothetical protein